MLTGRAAATCLLCLAPLAMPRAAWADGPDIVIGGDNNGGWIDTSVTVPGTGAASMSNYGCSTKRVLQRPVEPSQYTSKDFAKLCSRLGVTQSMGAVGTSADNAMAEAFNATPKRELLQGAASWPDELTCRREIFRWATRYNTRRRHSWCRQQSPNTYEQQHAATLPQAA